MMNTNYFGSERILSPHSVYCE